MLLSNFQAPCSRLEAEKRQHSICDMFSQMLHQNILHIFGRKGFGVRNPTSPSTNDIASASLRHLENNGILSQGYIHGAWVARAVSVYHVNLNLREKIL